ncbi:MAG: NADH-quinone oxidoreductase subunit J [Lachnospiraceae bacterium]|jgi:Na+-translocating ferredoxin:NAD+ oxidoreductase RnfC subunit|nr:NADH-quinone oxidoreductase subunit J [Lachnospiraceae bacterium]
MEIQELKNIMRESGIVGAGGAGFPSYGKLDKRMETIVLNCAECEPLLRVHRQLLRKYAYEILEALDIIAEAVEAKKVIIAVKGVYRKTIEAVERAFTEKKRLCPMEIGALPEIYPAGDEVITIYEVTGKVVPPGKLPIDIGIGVFNVETIYNVYRAVFEKQPVTYKYLTIGGEVREPKTIKAPIGMKIEEAVKLAGGSLVEEPVYVHGGPMTGPLVSGEEVITKTSNAVLVFHKNHLVVQNKKRKNSISMKRAMASCCQCRMCTDLCPRNLLGHPIEPHEFMKAATSGVTRNIEPFLNTYYCSQCGICEMYACMQNLAPKSLIASYKMGLREKQVKPMENPSFTDVHPMRRERKVPMKRLIAKLGLTAYDKEAPLTEEMPMASFLKIPLGQHIGALAKPEVAKGDKVVTGQKIAGAMEDKLSVSYHAPMNGEVWEVTEHIIMITEKVHG